jgi:N-acetylmuramoyl-L-alanine amidase
MRIVKRLSPNHGERKNAARPSFLILHYTGMATAGEALAKLCDPNDEKPVSAHYMVDEDGAVYGLVDEDRRAWHAGQSYWEGIEDINSHSIGIEIVNPGHDLGYRTFPPAQMKALIALCRDIMTRYDIPSHRILAHSDIAPDRRRNKKDPGELFDWKSLSKEGIGLWPAPLKEDFEKAAALVADEGKLRAALTETGYDPRVDLEDVITAFQRHFHPEVFSPPAHPGKADLETAARLCALLRMKNTL